MKTQELTSAATSSSSSPSQLKLSKSLPSDFRFHSVSLSTGATVPTSPFFNFRLAGYDGLNNESSTYTPTSTGAHIPKTRLEVLTGWEVNFSILSQYFATFISFLLVFYQVSQFSKHWVSSSLSLSAVLANIENIGRSCLIASSIILFIYFVISLLVSPIRTSEQYWTCILLFMPLFLNNPLLQHHHDHVILLQPKKFIISDSVYILIVYLYILLTIHSYRILNSSSSTDNNNTDSTGYINTCRRNRFNFYTPKLLIVLSYTSFLIFVSYYFKLSLGVIPSTRLYILFILCSNFNLFKSTISLYYLFVILCIIMIDMLFFYYIVKQIRKTADSLATVSYVENRAKQLGFRCFVYQLLSFCFCISLLSLIIFFNLPLSYLSFLSNPSNNRDHFVILQPSIGNLGLAFVYFSWNLVIAFVNLPPQPLLTNVGRTFARRLAPLARNRIAVWFGLADLVSTEEAEDADENEIDNRNNNELNQNDRQNQQHPQNSNNNQSSNNDVVLNLDENMMVNDYGAVVTPRHLSFTSNANKNSSSSSSSSSRNNNKSKNISSSNNKLRSVVVPPTKSIPMVYRHRELYDMVPITSNHSSNESIHNILSLASPPPPLQLSPANTALTNISSLSTSSPPISHQASKIGLPASMSLPKFLNDQENVNNVSENKNNEHEQIKRKLLSKSKTKSKPHLALPRDSDFLMCRRLKLKKNLFVMETQVLMANVAYLSYIFGNQNEELPSAVQFREKQKQKNPLKENEVSETETETEKQEEQEEQEEQPDFDNGSMFRIDPYKMAERYGFTVFRYICCEELNTHAVVLVSPSRVVVAFSGTRDASNWKTNADVNREVLDEYLTRFEYEIENQEEQENTVAKKENKQKRNSSTNATAKNHGFKDCNQFDCDESYALLPPVPQNDEQNEEDIEKGLGNGKEADELEQQGLKKKDSLRRSVSHDFIQPNHLRHYHSTSVVPSATIPSDSTYTTAYGGSTPSLNLLWHTQPQNKYNENTPILNKNGSPSDCQASAQGQSSRSIADPVRCERCVRCVKNQNAENRSRRRSRGKEGERLNSNNTTSNNSSNRNGTTEQVSMITSALAHELRTFGQAKVHRGFLEAYISIRKKVLGALVELYGKEHHNYKVPLYFCGHSLGGAMAIFACYEAARYYRRIGIHRRQDISCTTFGCPRIGNEAFKMRYERLCESHYRFEMAVDPIPKVPNILNYYPVGIQILIDESGMLLIDPSFIEVQWWGRLSNPYMGYRLHIRASYCMALRTYCKKYRSGLDDLESHFWPFPLRVQTKGLFNQLQFNHEP